MIPDYEAVICECCAGDLPLQELLVRHSIRVRDKALAIAAMPENRGRGLDLEIVAAGAMLHDVGIVFCNAPGILCKGTEPYIRHGVLGGAYLRQWGAHHQQDMEIYAGICERHTGAGLTAEEIVREGLALPAEDFLPRTPEEKLICLADKFYSKSGSGAERSLAEVRKSLQKFGAATCQRLENLIREFHLD